MELTSENVTNILKDCLFEKDTPEAREKAVIVEGVVGRFGFDPEKLKKHEEEITSMLLQLPETFQEGKGGGWSFLQACVRQDGMQWAEHRNIDELTCLGLAIKKVKMLAPREMWEILPGGMPYFAVTV